MPGCNRISAARPLFTTQMVTARRFSLLHAFATAEANLVIPACSGMTTICASTFDPPAALDQRIGNARQKHVQRQQPQRATKHRTIAVANIAAPQKAIAKA